MSGEDVIAQIVRNIAAKPQKKLSIAVFASGNGSNLQALLDFSKRDSCYFSVCSVITNSPDSLSLQRAKEAHVDHHLVDHRLFKSRAEFEREILSKLPPGIDLIVLAGFLRVLSRTFLSRYENRVINLHPSLLPKHPGLDAIKKAMAANDHETGCTVHLVDDGLDTGPIIAQRSCPIYPSDSLDDVKERIRALEHQLLPSIVNEIASIATTKTNFVDSQNELKDF